MSITSSSSQRSTVASMPASTALASWWYRASDSAEVEGVVGSMIARIGRMSSRFRSSLAPTPTPAQHGSRFTNHGGGASRRSTRGIAPWIACAIGAALLLGGCGQKGALKLPTPTSAPATGG
ncbi:LPS translocon maturation chaperone LptM [Sphaerotilus hippei]|uniref:LPS translocon maturation chaperone LptM n=1 Tax=Sphaerotilus hippei TaxID=744406 RepID=UPI0035C1D125